MIRFRVVIHLSRQSKGSLYIAYRGMAGSQLKNPCLCNAASHHETRKRIFDNGRGICTNARL